FNALALDGGGQQIERQRYATPGRFKESVVGRRCWLGFLFLGLGNRAPSQVAQCRRLIFTLWQRDGFKVSADMLVGVAEGVGVPGTNGEPSRAFEQNGDVEIRHGDFRRSRSPNAAQII